MSSDPTEIQDAQELRRTRDLSLKRGHPPTQVPGYEFERFLGVGAYGEVWVALEKNTGRRVAIKFYAHRGGLDWSLLSREVEKLAFLFADRYVVQLLAVGWDAEPPYYVMEYLERGSLAERLQQGPLPVDQAVAMFRDIATGLLHSHNKGILHCDLKPANILLDQDNKPRLADFGQSRLSSEQAPALGTIFYMAPEQADLNAVPDARWDVYALGAVFYCMLTGSPPHRTGPVADDFEHTADLDVRLARYRQLIEQAPAPARGRLRGVDRALAEIVDRCLAPDPARRFSTVQGVLDALDLRAKRRARRPLMVLGAVGPLLLVLVVFWIASLLFGKAVERSTEALIRSALASNHFAAENVARTAADELDHRCHSLEQAASSPRFHLAIGEVLAKAQLSALSVRLSDPKLGPADLERLRGQFYDHPDRQVLQREFEQLIASVAKPWEKGEVTGWSFYDAQGTAICRVPERGTIGKNYAWRSYFHGGTSDRDQAWRPPQGEHLQKTQLSAVFLSQATSRWAVAIATPVYDDSPEPKFLGVLCRTADVGRFIEFPGSNAQQFAVLVDNREGDNRGLIVQHPLLDNLLTEQGQLPERFKSYRLDADDLSGDVRRQANYVDPMASDPEGKPFDRRWLAAMEPIHLRGEDTGWLVIVQESYDAAIGSTLKELGSDLVRYGAAALLLVVLVMAGLWAFVMRLMNKY